MPVVGMFLSHARSPRIERHFDRLARETAGEIEWHLVCERTERSPEGEDFADENAGSILAWRFEQRRRNDGVQGGFMDTAIWPRLLALEADFTWIVEYDVDFSGNWARLFEQFATNPADLLTTTIVPRSDCCDWFWWRSAAAPPSVQPEQMFRAFLPVMRVSRRLAQAYARAMEDHRWSGHYEFTIPTAALAAGLVVEDIGGTGPLCPRSRLNRNYRNSPSDWRLSPGTLVWRPSRDRYFVEAPHMFAERDMLYHPVKADVPEWRKEFAVTKATTVVPPTRLSALRGQAAHADATTVSVALITYNGARFLREQLESLVRQDTLPDELVVCDDGSTDSTVEILREFASNAPFSVEVAVNHETIGYSRNAISAARRCRGKLILFCDQDDLWSPDKIAAIAEVADAFPEQVISHDIAVFSADSSRPRIPSYFDHLRRLAFSPAVCVKGCATAVKAEFIRTWGWPRADADVSYDVWIALLATAFRQRRYIDRPLIEYRLHDRNASGWIASDLDRVRSQPEAERQRQSDTDLLIELCIKRRNLHWTDEFVRALREPRADAAEEDRSRLLRSLETNRAYYSRLPGWLRRFWFRSA